MIFLYGYVIVAWILGFFLVLKSVMREYNEGRQPGVFVPLFVIFTFPVVFPVILSISFLVHILKQRKDGREAKNTPAE